MSGAQATRLIILFKVLLGGTDMECHRKIMMIRNFRRHEEMKMH